MSADIRRLTPEIAVAPQLALAEPDKNADTIVELAREAHEQNAALALFPELGLSAYSNDDLFQQDALLDAIAMVPADVRDRGDGDGDRGQPERQRDGEGDEPQQHQHHVRDELPAARTRWWIIARRG